MRITVYTKIKKCIQWDSLKSQTLFILHKNAFCDIQQGLFSFVKNKIIFGQLKFQINTFIYSNMGDVYICKIKNRKFL